jgi:GAF domain-containing protein
VRKKASGRDADLPTVPRVESPTAILRLAGARILEARSASVIEGVVLSTATELCGASGAVWWERSGRGISGKLAYGKAAGSTGVVAMPDGLPGQEPGQEDGAGLLLALPSEQPGGAAFLDQVGASRAVLAPVRDGGRWFGLLSVHDGTSDPSRLDLLVALVQQAASALRSLALTAQTRKSAREKRAAPAQFGAVLTSALNLDDLLDMVCRLAMGAVSADACLLFLADEATGLRLRASAGTIGDSAAFERELLDLGELTRSDSDGVIAWHQGSRLPPAIGALLHRSLFTSLLGIALSVRGEPMGALLLLSKHKRGFPPQQRRRVLLLSTQAAVAVENLQLFESTQRRLLEVADLNWVSTRISASHSVPAIAAIAADAAARALDAPRVALFVARADGDFEPIPSAQLGIPTPTQESLAPEGHIGAEVLETGSLVAVADAEAEGKAEDQVVRWLGARSVLCVPMTAQPGLRGFFVVGDTRPRTFRSHDIGLLSNYANQAALALQSATLYDDVVRHLNELSRLFDVSRSLASSLDLSENLNTVLTSASDLLDAPVCSVMLSDPETGELVVKAAHGFQQDDELYERVRPGDGLSGCALQSGLALTSTDLSRDGRFKFRQRAREQGLRTAIAAPLIARGRPLGVLNLYRNTAREFTEADKRLLMSLANSAAVAIENANLYQEARERAEFLSAMMSEINHRIRNTLQAIAGLLRMELDRPQASAESAIRRGISRIQAVAVVHELMRARELQFVDMKQVARRIVQIMCQAITTRCPVDVDVSGARVTLPSQKATSVALILAELVDNTLRHGIAHMEDGRVAIGLAEGGGEVVIHVRDNGVGLPESFDLDSDSGFGLKIVRGLVEDELRGKLEMECKDGLLVRFRFAKV